MSKLVLADMALRQLKADIADLNKMYPDEDRSVQHAMVEALELQIAVQKGEKIILNRDEELHKYYKKREARIHQWIRTLAAKIESMDDE